MLQEDMLIIQHLTALRVGRCLLDMETWNYTNELVLVQLLLLLLL